MLSFIIFSPLAAAAACLLVPRSRESSVKWVALLGSLVTFVATIALLVLFDKDDGGFQYTERVTWIDSEAAGFELQYLLGVDGLSVALVVLTGLLTVVSVLVSFAIGFRQREYFFWLLVLEAGVLGVFCALDLILFFLFWEVELVPMY